MTSHGGGRCQRPSIPVLHSETCQSRIEIDPDVMLGKPVIRGTRIPVEIVLRKLSDGATTQDLLFAYPRLTPDDIRAALVYAADTIAHETLVVLA